VAIAEALGVPLVRLFTSDKNGDIATEVKHLVGRLTPAQRRALLAELRGMLG
jgi:hypothetical protein